MNKNFDLIPTIDEFDNDSTRNLSLVMTPIATDAPLNPFAQHQSPAAPQPQQQHLLSTSVEQKHLEEILGEQTSINNRHEHSVPKFNTTNSLYANRINSYTPLTPVHVHNQGQLGRPPFFPMQRAHNISHQQQQQLPQRTQHYQQQSVGVSKTDSDYSASTSVTSDRRKRRHTEIENETDSLSNNTKAAKSEPSTDGNQCDQVPTDLSESVVIDQNMLVQLGGLAYAELCKERAREAFKEAKKNEYLTNGNFDRLRRTKKGDTSMTQRDKYLRRLRMNQDSAAAARYAQEVFVSVLKRLVGSLEDEKKSFIAQVNQVRSHYDQMKHKEEKLNSRVKQLEEENQLLRLQQSEQKTEQQQQNKGSNTADSNDLTNEMLHEKQYDPAFTKYLDLFKDVATVDTQPELGVQPARAV